MRLLWLPTVLRAAGLTVHEVPGWQKRGADSYGPVRGITCHETRGSASSTDAGEIGVLVNGRPGLSGPIAQLYVSRSGHWHVVASGAANHNYVGWAGPNKGFGNDSLLGVEAQHSADEDWRRKPAQYASYVRGVAAILKHTGWPVARVGGHKEHQPYPAPPGKSVKSDPEFDMDQFRRDVAAVLAGEAEQMTPQQAQQLRDAHYTTAVAIPNPAGEGKVPLHVWAGWMTGAVKALAAAVAGVDEATRAQLDDEFKALRAGIAAVPDAVVDELDGVDSDQEVAARLRALLGDRASRVGALLAATD